MKINCIAVDDEPLALELIEEFASRTSQLDLTAKFRSPLRALDYIKINSVDLVFLDIQMPELTGLQLADLLNSSNPPKLIFITAYREHAVESYNLRAADYLVKPFSFQRFLQAVDKVVELIANEKKSTDGFINVKSEGKTFRLNFDEIVFIESFKDYIKIYTSSKSLICYQHITNFSKQLPPGSFLRVHRAFIVNINKIVSFSSSYIQIGQEELPIGRSYKDKVSSMLN